MGEFIEIRRKTLSHALATLEAELGVALLERGRGCAAAIGGCILRYVCDILSKVETIQQQAAAVRWLHVGKLRVGIVSSLSATILAGILRKFRHECPDIDVVTFQHVLLANHKG
jgi:DNA-binding transcriptional LysR family regulator